MVFLQLAGQTSQSRVRPGSPGSSEVHEEIAVVDPWHPDQLLILGHSLATRRGERLQLRELGLIGSEWRRRGRGTDGVTPQIACKLEETIRFQPPVINFSPGGGLIVTRIQYLNTTLGGRDVPAALQGLSLRVWGFVLKMAQAHIPLRFGGSMNDLLMGFTSR